MGAHLGQHRPRGPRLSSKDHLIFTFQVDKVDLVEELGHQGPVPHCKVVEGKGTRECADTAD